MHSIGLLGALIIGPPILMMGVPFLGAAIFYSFFVSLILNIYLAVKLRKAKNK
jgi:hypothetical protein